MSNEAELMKNLSANEKRRLMRHVEQGSPKKTSSKPSSAAASRNYNPTPKPFGSGVSVGPVSAPWSVKCDMSFHRNFVL